MNGASAMRFASALAGMLAVGGLEVVASPGSPDVAAGEAVRLQAGDVIAVAIRSGGQCARRFVRLARDSVIVVDAGPRLPCRPALVVFRAGVGVFAAGLGGPPPDAVMPPRFWRIVVPVRFIVATDAPARGLAWIGPLFADLQQIYAANEVGVDFVNTGTDTVEDPPVYLRGGCSLDDVTAFVRSAYYHPDTLNVVLLDSIVGFGKEEGLTCFLQEVDGKLATNVIFLGLLYVSDATFPHEVGHALGLQGTTCGHVNELLGKPDCGSINYRNLMIQRHTGMHPFLWMFRDHFTRGQVFRMNYDSGSFLNLAGLRGGRPVEVCQKVCCVLNRSDADYGCGGDPGTPCLRLADDEPGGGQ